MKMIGVWNVQTQIEGKRETKLPPIQILNKPPSLHIVVLTQDLQFAVILSQLSKNTFSTLMISSHWFLNQHLQKT